MTQATFEAQGLTRLLAELVHGTDGIADAIAVSSDGLLMAMSEGLTREGGEQLAAIVSGIAGLSKSAARRYGFEGLKLVMIEMNRGFLLVSAIAGGSCLGVLAAASCDLGLVGREMAVLSERMGGLR